MAGDVAETFEAVAEANGKTLNSDIAPGITVTGDPTLLVQMLVNAVENAIEHAQGSTSISLELSDRAGRPVLAVADHGPGIPISERERVFEQFYRLDHSRGTGGSGLGLTIVASIARIHGVEIELRDNNPGLRLVFVFGVP